MSRLSSRLQALRGENRAGLIAYLVAGDPAPAATVSLMHAMVEGGADVIELGVPFTDPVADGPVIQAACERALRAGTSLTDVFDMLRAFRVRDSVTPVVLMGYLNPLEAWGYERYAAAAAGAGADALLVVDLPAEEAGELAAVLKRNALELVGLVSPTTSADRLASICESASGFVYYVSLKGVTGAGTSDRAGMDGQIARIRSRTSLAIAAGFGIADAATAQAVVRSADAVIVGSALVRQIAEHGANAAKAISATLAELRQALDSNAAAAAANGQART